MATQLSVLMRPKRLDELVGQPAAVAYVRGMMAKQAAPNLVLIVGPSGTGKTTLARIVAALLSGYRGDPDKNPDMRDHSGNVNRTIEDVRDLIAFSRFLPKGGRRRCIVVDEVQGFVGPAASALLKATEDPPPHVTWLFCTDQPGKLLQSVKNRAQPIVMRLLTDEDMTRLCHWIVQEAKIPLRDRALDAVTARVTEMSYGAPRQAVQYLELVHTSMLGGATAREALQSAIESNQAADGFDSTVRYLTAALMGRARDAVLALGDGDGSGVLEMIQPMMSGLVRKAAGGKPNVPLGWGAVRAVQHRCSLDDLLAFEHRVVGAIMARAASNFAVSADAVLFALAHTTNRGDGK